MKRADSLLTSVIRDLGIRDGVRLTGIRKDWAVLFASPIPFHTYPLVLSGDDLVIAVDSPVWLQELQFYKEDIIRKLGPYEVKSVRFRLGRVSAKAKPEDKSRRVKARMLTDEEHAFILEESARISDGGLKETVKTAIEKAIRAGKTKIS